MKFYNQTTEYTCAASSLLIILNHFKNWDLKKENEFKIWMKTAILPVRASSIYGMAVLAKKQGLNPSIVLGEKEYDYPDYRFKRYTKKDIDEAKFTSKLHSKEARELNIPIEEKTFSINEVKNLLNQNKILLLRVNAGVLRDSKSTSKYVVVFNDKGYKIIDPKRGFMDIDLKTLENAMTTLETKKKRDQRMIIF
jgi:hypothetical protein